MQCALAYYRVSTNRQGVSGLGLEAQQRAVQEFAARNGLALVEEVTEVETGTAKRHRPKLQEALERCQRQGCALIVSSVDRLARNVKIISSILESAVKVFIVDMPSADTFTLQVLSAVAEKEAKSISTRTKSALESAKLRGVKLGKPENFTDAGRKKGAKIRQEKSQKTNSLVAEIVRMKREKSDTYAQIAAYLTSINAAGKAKWFPMQVKRILEIPTNPDS